MKKSIFILFCIMTGALLLPKLSVACNMDIDAHAACCQSKVAEQETRSPGPSDKQSSQKEHASDDCNHSDCGCLSINLIVAICMNRGTDNPLTSIGITNTSLSDAGPVTGFHSIWLPPKIN